MSPPGLLTPLPERRPAVEQYRDRRGQRHDDCDLPCPRTDRGEQQSADADSDAGPDDQLERSTQTLAECHIDADDGCHRR
jgi:hypothetical protein